MKFTIRKLCSSIEEFEVMADENIDLDLLSVSLSKMPDLDVSYCPPILTILFEDEGAVVKLYASGRALVRANVKQDVERVCSILVQTIEESQ